ncbi:cation diffusion facilitator family transporter [Larkinella arboricola]|uniref:Cation diffusion facilitator family transporter n=1 Tax=Larkinella arboricola TaxID=643671 RepID=A0A327X5R0_LARAB|nr:cation diffusion facilitator family transporter [Larkinella arboricola]RAK00443.1 cation diffusion facilitator family transporter [Larkinella arboricola]
MQPSQRTKYKWMTISLVLSVALMLLKFAAWWLTSSTAVLTDALESIINVIASGFALYSIYLSGLPRDRNHPYGHGKIEFFSSGFEGALILSAGGFIIFQAIESFSNPQPITYLGWGVALIGLTAVANALVGWLLIRNGRSTNSITLMADGRHLLIDSLSSVMVLAGLGFIELTGLAWLDGVLSLILSAVIIWNGFGLIRHSVAGLMDETDLSLLQRILTILNQHKRRNWIDVHNMRAQRYGADLHIDCHLTLPYYWTLAQVHQEVHEYEGLLKQEIATEVEIFVHADPCLPECCSYCRITDCPVRAHTFSGDIVWTIANISTNQKHFVTESA